MGIMRNIAEKVVDKTVQKVETAVVIGTLETVAAGAEVAIDAGKKTSSFVSKTVSKAIERSNNSALKKENKKTEHYLLVTKEKGLGKGIYTVSTKKREERYNTLYSQSDDQFVIKLYTETDGEIAVIWKEKPPKSIFKKHRQSGKYLIKHKEEHLGCIAEGKEDKQKIYITDFNDWVATGDFLKGNYKIFSEKTGKTLAAVSKKHKSASTYSIVLEHDENEAILVFLTILIDLIDGYEGD